jgi:hypothetical protein
MKNLIPYFSGFFIIKTSVFTTRLYSLTLGLACLELLAACTSHTALLEPTGLKKISFEQANARLAKKPSTSDTAQPAIKELEQLQQEISGLKQLLGQLSTAQSNTYKNNQSTPTSVFIQAKSFDPPPLLATHPIVAKQGTKVIQSSNSEPIISVVSQSLTVGQDLGAATNKSPLTATPPLAQMLQIEADARLLAFHVLASDKTIINTLRRWAEQEQWSVKLNGELIDKQHFPAHTVAYTDFSHGEKINSIGGATLLQAVANLMQQLKPYQHQIQLDIQLRKTESQMVLTASAKATSLQANSLASKLNPAPITQ